MAMAVATAAVPLTQFCAPRAAGNVRDCRNRLESSPLSVCPTGFPSAIVRSVAHGGWGGCTTNNIASRRDSRWKVVAEQMEAETVSEAVSADAISMFLEAEGSLAESLVVKLTKTMEAVEGVSDVSVSSTPDGTATVKLTKQMNVQETGVASGLVEILTKAGFKLQALNLGFDEDGEDDEDLYDYNVSSSAEDGEEVATE